MGKDRARQEACKVCKACGAAWKSRRSIRWGNQKKPAVRLAFVRRDRGWAYQREAVARGGWGAPSETQMFWATVA